MTPQQQAVFEQAAAACLSLGQLLQALVQEAAAQAPLVPGRDIHWITPDEATAIAGTGTTKRQLYRWAVGKRWASRPSRKKLLIDEAGFRKWLLARAGPGPVEAVKRGA